MFHQMRIRPGLSNKEQESAATVEWVYFDGTQGYGGYYIWVD